MADEPFGEDVNDVASGPRAAGLLDSLDPRVEDTDSGGRAGGGEVFAELGKQLIAGCCLAQHSEGTAGSGRPGAGVAGMATSVALCPAIIRGAGSQITVSHRQQAPFSSSPRKSNATRARAWVAEDAGVLPGLDQPGDGVLVVGGPPAGLYAFGQRRIIPGGGRPHREQITRELTATCHPRCDTQQYDQSWKDEWIGEYSAPTTGPVSRHSPDRAWPDRLSMTGAFAIARLYRRASVRMCSTSSGGSLTSKSASNMPR
jgi:hypothetical protein